MELFVECLGRAQARSQTQSSKQQESIVVEVGEDLCSTLELASKQGQWVCCDAIVMGYELLREAVHTVWLRAQWNHHPRFRFWVVDGSLRELTLEQGGREEEMLPFILSRSAINLRYTDAFVLEFEARELVSFVEDSYLAGVYANNQHIVQLQPHDVVMLFKKAKQEDIFLALLQDEDGSVTKAMNYIIEARSVEGYSPMDVALEFDYRTAAVKLRDAGCKSERFDFDRLLLPSFQTMLSLLLDPWKPFPFDPVISASRIAQANRKNVLQKVFASRVDVEFEGSDYPLAEACVTEDIDTYYIVVDRMGATGVNPFQDYRLCHHFLVKLLTVDYGVVPPLLEPGRMVDKPLTPFVAQTLHKFCDVIIAEEIRVQITMDCIKRASNFAAETNNLITKILQCCDVAQVDNADELLNFYIDYDPHDEAAVAVTHLGLEKVGSTAGMEVDVKTFNFLARMIRVGPRAAPMTKVALELAVHRDYVPLWYRVENKTLLMIALEYPPNVEAVDAILAVTNEHNLERLVNQIDESGNNVLCRLVVQLVKNTEHYALHLDSYGDIVERLLNHKATFVVSSPDFPVGLFLLAARQDLGEICYELLPTRAGADVDKAPPSLPLTCTANLNSLMVERHLRKIKTGKISNDNTDLDSRLIVEPNFVAGETYRTVTSELPLPILGKIASFVERRSLPALLRTSVAWYYGALLDSAWRNRIPPQPVTDDQEQTAAHRSLPEDQAVTSGEQKEPSDTPAAESQSDAKGATTADGEPAAARPAHTVGAMTTVYKANNADLTGVTITTLPLPSYTLSSMAMCKQLVQNGVEVQ